MTIRGLEKEIKKLVELAQARKGALAEQQAHRRIYDECDKAEDEQMERVAELLDAHYPESSGSQRPFKVGCYGGSFEHQMCVPCDNPNDNKPESYVRIA